MPGVWDVLAPRLLAEIGDVRRFDSGIALIAYAGIDTPPYESGMFVGNDEYQSEVLLFCVFDKVRHREAFSPVYRFAFQRIKAVSL